MEWFLFLEGGHSPNGIRYAERTGQEWIRTTEGDASGFTVRPVWPLRYLPVFLRPKAIGEQRMQSLVLSVHQKVNGVSCIGALQINNCQFLEGQRAGTSSLLKLALEMAEVSP